MYFSSINESDGKVNFRGKDKRIEQVSAQCFNGLSLPTKDFEIVSLEIYFGNSESLTTIEFLSLFDTSNVTSMEDMFYNCSGLSSLDLLHLIQVVLEI